MFSKSLAALVAVLLSLCTVTSATVMFAPVSAVARTANATVVHRHKSHVYWHGYFHHHRECVTARCARHGDEAFERHRQRELARQRAREEREAGNSSDLANVPGVPYAFAKCVALRESTDGRDPAAHGNIYGILSSNGFHVGMPLSAQKRLFAKMYAESGTQPWSPYDHC